MTPTQYIAIGMLQSVASAWYTAKLRTGECLTPASAWIAQEFAQACTATDWPDMAEARRLALNALLDALGVRHIMDVEAPREDLLAAVAKAIRTVRGGAE